MIRRVPRTTSRSASARTAEPGDFDIGFGELLLCGVVALLVLGPERLPQAARTAGLWVGRLRTTVQRFTADIDRELKAEELRQTLREQAQRLTEPVEALRQDIAAAGSETQAASGQEADAVAGGGRRSGSNAPAGDDGGA